MTEEELQERVDYVARALHRFELDVKRQFAEVNAQFAEVNAQFAEVGQRFDRLEQRMDQFDQRLGTLDHKLMLRFDDVIERLDALKK